MTIATYVAYLGLSAVILLWVGVAFRRNADVLFDRDSGDQRSAAGAHMLSIAFYLVNASIVLWNLPSGERIGNAAKAIEVGARHLGTVLFVTGVMHLFLVAYLARKRRVVARLAARQAAETRTTIRRVS